MTNTYTVASLPVSVRTYTEIARKLKEAGYDHALMDDGNINMQGIALQDGSAPGHQLKWRSMLLNKERSKSFWIEVTKNGEVSFSGPATSERGDTGWGFWSMRERNEDPVAEVHDFWEESGEAPTEEELDELVEDVHVQGNILDPSIFPDCRHTGILAGGETVTYRTKVFWLVSP